MVRRCEADTGRPSDGSMIEMVADHTGHFRFAGLQPRAWRLFHFEQGKENGEVPGPWFELLPGVEETAELGK